MPGTLPAARPDPRSPPQPPPPPIPDLLPIRVAKRSRQRYLSKGRLGTSCVRIVSDLMPCGGCSLNETFCHALLKAGINEEDVAARLGVDTKTVRRWIEGRALPYRRHRWALAALLSTAETDLWPQLRSAQPRPEELVAIYPHLGTVPREVWLRLFGSAQREISLLDHRERPLAADRDLARSLAEKATAELTVRICLAESGDTEASPRWDPSTPTADLHDALALYAPLRQG